MNKDSFKFFLYRLNKEVRNDLFAKFDHSKSADDESIKEFFKLISNEKYDIINETSKSNYIWSLRNFQDITKEYSSIVLAQSVSAKESQIVTSDSITSGYSISSPPPAKTIIILFYWPRHIAIVENRSGMTTGETWLKHYHTIIENAKLSIDIPIVPVLEPIPLKGSIIKHLIELDKVYRFRVKIRLPNPDLSRWSKHIYDEMIENKIQEYLQEMTSSEGLKVDEGSRIHGTAALAELGYKSGGAKIDGTKDGKTIHLDEGKTAIKGKIDQLKSCIKGLETNVRSKELERALKTITLEIDRLFPSDL